MRMRAAPTRAQYHFDSRAGSQDLPDDMRVSKSLEVAGIRAMQHSIKI